MVPGEITEVWHGKKGAEESGKGEDEGKGKEENKLFKEALYKFFIWIKCYWIKCYAISSNKEINCKKTSAELSWMKASCLKNLI